MCPGSWRAEAGIGDAVLPLTVTTCVFSAAAVLGDLLVLGVTLGVEKLRSPMGAHVASLAVADLLKSSLVVPLWLLHLNGELGGGPPCTAAACARAGLDNANGFALALVSYAAVFTLASVSAERADAFCNPLHHVKRWTWPAVHRALAAVWVAAAAAAAVPVFLACGYELSWPGDELSYRFGPNGRAARGLLVSCVTVPLAAICALYVRIYLVVQSQANKGHYECNEVNCRWVSPRTRQWKPLKLLIAITGLCLVSWVPYSVVTLIGRHSHAEKPHVLAIVHVLAEWLMFTATAINPWLFSLPNKDFRQAIRSVWAHRPWTATFFANSTTATTTTTTSITTNTTSTSSQPCPLCTCHPPCPHCRVPLSSLRHYRKHPRSSLKCLIKCRYSWGRRVASTSPTSTATNIPRPPPMLCLRPAPLAPPAPLALPSSPAPLPPLAPPALLASPSLLAPLAPPSPLAPRAAPAPDALLSPPAPLATPSLPAPLSPPAPLEPSAPPSPHAPPAPHSLPAPLAPPAPLVPPAPPATLAPHAPPPPTSLYLEIPMVLDCVPQNIAMDLLLPRNKSLLHIVNGERFADRAEGKIFTVS